MYTQQVVVPLRFDPVHVPLLSLDLGNDGPDVVIAITGELDPSTAHLLTEMVSQLIGSHAGQVVLDMAGVTFFSAAGIHALIQAQKAVAATGRRLTLRDPSPPTRRILAITGDDHRFGLSPAPTQPDRATAAQRLVLVRSPESNPVATPLRH